MRSALRGILAVIASASLLLTAVGCPFGGSPLPNANTLTLRLDPSLAGEDADAPLVSAIENAELLSSTGGVVQTATISGGTAVFSIGTLIAGRDYFIRINSLADALVPTRLDTTTGAVEQSISPSLQTSVVGPANEPTYRVRTFLQPHKGIVRYSNGLELVPRQTAYAVLTRTTPPSLSIRVLGTGEEVNSFSPTVTTHPGIGPSLQPFDTFTLDLLSTAHHGAVYGGDDTRCSACHGNLDVKVLTFGTITPLSANGGWCFRCHYGKLGDELGFVDPLQ